MCHIVKGKVFQYLILRSLIQPPRGKPVFELMALTSSSPILLERNLTLKEAKAMTKVIEKDLATKKDWPLVRPDVKDNGPYLRPWAQDVLRDYLYYEKPKPKGAFGLFA